SKIVKVYKNQSSLSMSNNERLFELQKDIAYYKVQANNQQRLQQSPQQSIDLLIDQSGLPNICTGTQKTIKLLKQPKIIERVQTRNKCLQVLLKKSIPEFFIQCPKILKYDYFYKFKTIKKI
ncbi:hypothetical protein ABPG74_006699, partial [Tetrahymena malaccensis]